MPSVRHFTSVQGADDPGKSVQAAQWNENHILSNVASQTQLDDLSTAVSALSVVVGGIGGGEVHPTSAEFISLQANFSTLSIQVTTVSSAISVVAANLSTLSVSDSVMQAQVNTLSGTVSTIQGQVNTLSGQHSTLSLAVSAVQAQVNTLSTQVTAVSGAISTLSLAVSVVEANRNLLSQFVSSEAAQMNTLSAQVTSVSAAVSVVAANLSALSVSDSAMQAQLNTLSGLHSTLSAQVTTVSGAVSTLSLAVSVVAANHSALSVLESALSVQVSVLSAQMTSLVAAKVVMLGDQTISVSALTNVSGQSFSVGANNTYCFKYMIVYQAASTATGLGLSVTFPGMKTFGATAYITSGATGTANQFSGAITASGTKIQALSCQTAATDFYAVLEGGFTVSTSGTLQLQANSGVGGTSAQVIIRRGTFGALWRGA